MMKSRAKAKIATQTDTDRRLVQILATGSIVAGALVLAAVSARAADYGGAGIPGETPCYAVFHELPDGQGISVERQGPESVEKIRRLRYADGRNLNHRVMSVTTGPAAVLTLYDASRFRVMMMEVGPDSRVNLAKPVMDSYHLRCTAPPAPPAYAPPPDFK